ncbi:MAG: acetyltransferase [Gammaproteobacteria bacterium]
MPTSVSIIGAGGHALVVMDALTQLGVPFDLWDQNPNHAGHLRLGCIVRHMDDATFAALSDQAHVAIGHNATRAKLVAQLAGAGKTLFTVVHPMASVAASATIAAGAFVGANATVAPLASVGRAAIINHGAVVDHDAVVEDCAHLAQNATLCGRARLGRCAKAGAASVISTACVVGAEADIAPCTVVGENSTATGVTT